MVASLVFVMARKRKSGHLSSVDQASQPVVSLCQIISNSAVSHLDVHYHWFLDLWTFSFCLCFFLVPCSISLVLGRCLPLVSTHECLLLGISCRRSLISHVLLFFNQDCVSSWPILQHQLQYPPSLHCSPLGGSEPSPFPFVLHLLVFPFPFFISTDHQCFTSRRFFSFSVELLNGLTVFFHFPRNCFGVQLMTEHQLLSHVPRCFLDLL